MCALWKNAVLGLVAVLFISCSLAEEPRQVPRHRFKWAMPLNTVYECREAWTLRGAKCYSVLEVETTWDRAEQLCHSYGAELVRLDGIYDNDFVGGLARDAGITDFWIGLQVEQQSADSLSATWSDGSFHSPIVGFWGSVQPDPTQGQCVGVSTTPRQDHTHLWQLYPCQLTLPSVCHMPAKLQDQSWCANGRVVPNSDLCDSVDDCGDFSDEISCGCYEAQSGETGTVASLSPYMSSTDCLYYIEGPAGSYIQLQFNVLTIEESVDIIQVMAGGATPSSSIVLAESSAWRVIPGTLYSYNHQMIVRFYTDSSVEMTGFSATWTAVSKIPGCGDTLTASPTESNFVSPFYPDPYPMNQDCEWLITAPEGDLITLKVDALKLGEEDYLDIYDGSDVYSIRMAHLTSEVTMETIISSGHVVFVRFHSGLTRWQPDVDLPVGFLIKYYTGCDQILASDMGVVSSPGYVAGVEGAVYPNQLACTWEITTSQALLRLVFEDLELEDGWDFLQLYHGTSRSLQPWPVVTGEHAEDYYDAYTYFMKLDFSTSSVIRRKGFTAKYSVACPVLNIDQTYTDITTGSAYARQYTTDVHVVCKKGAEFTAEEFVDMDTVETECLYGGQWSIGRTPQCMLRYCGLPGSIPNGFLDSTTGMTVGAIASYQCDSGFTMASGTGQVQCLETGYWDTLPACQGTECPPVSIAHADKTVLFGTGISHGSILEIQCQDGWSMTGVPLLQCGDSVWLPELPTCAKLECAVPYVSHGWVVGQPILVVVGGQFQVNCDEGYELDSDEPIECLNNQTWSRLPVCEDKDGCESKSNGGCQQECYDVEGAHFCRCWPGYQPVSPDGATCEDVNECLDDNAGCSHRCSNIDGSYTCSCPDGYQLYEEGVSDLSLTVGSDWHLDNLKLVIDHTCVPLKCPDTLPTPKSLPVPLYRGGPQYVGDSITYLCTYPHVLEGQAEVICVESGNWEPIYSPKCELPVCPGLEIPDSVIYKPVPDHTDPVMFGEYVNFTCSVGRAQPITLQRICLYNTESDSFELMGDPLECPVTNCSTPMQIPWAVYTDLGATVYTSTFTVECEAGAVISGDGQLGGAAVVCDEYGLWDFGTLACIKQTCTDPGRPAGGAQNATTYQEGALVFYQCDREGYAPSDPWPLLCGIEGNKLVWNSTVPTCVDVEPPMFSQCPSAPIAVALYSSLSDLPGFQAPDATDNTAVVSLTTVPQYFSTDQIIAADLLVTYTAMDDAGNTEQCQLEILLQDNDPPALMCPGPYSIYLDENSEASVTMVTDAPATATDNFGNVTLTYDPEFIHVNTSDLDRSFLVAVTAVDDAGNMASCQFEVTVQASLCTEWSLPAPINGMNKCFSPVRGGLYCQLECENNYFFSDTSQADFTFQCQPDGQWQPDTNVPNCVESSRGASYEVTFTMNYDISDTSPSQFINPACWTEYKPDIESSFPDISAFFTSGCSKTNLQKNVTFDSVTSTSISANQMVAEFSLSIQPDGMSVSFYEDCRDYILSIVELTIDPSGTYPLAIVPLVTLDEGIGGCPWLEGKASETIDSTSGWQCPVGTRLVQTDQETVCVPCAPGSYLSNGTCELCPLGTYHHRQKSAVCINCPAGTYTHSQGSSFQHQCLDMCPEGFVSSTGSKLPPCEACPVGTYSNGDICESCPVGYSTHGTGHNSSEACIAPCQAGEYSQTGYEPCQSCPIGFYSTNPTSTLCDECPLDKTTATEAATSQASCDLGDPCGTMLCTFGTCIVANHLAVCVCDEGFHGDTCSDMVDMCQSSPCYYGGQCTTTSPGQFSCACTEGTSEARCEVEQDDCLQNDCQNNAMCQDLHLDFNCLCPSEGSFTGEKCDSAKDVCADQPCQNGALCIPVHAEGRSCRCTEGFTGDSCEFEKDGCEPVNPCFHGGRCSDTPDGYSCDCSDGYQGDRCQERLDGCLGVVCSGGGTCIDDYRNGTVYCLCAHGFERKGADCVQKDYCQPNPCLRGSCNPSVASFQCPCDAGFTGPRCASDIDDCLSDRCANGATCIDGVDSFTCQCTQQYEGLTCSDEIDECTVWNECDITGTKTCRDLLYGYQCVCNDGYTGRNCSEEVNECLSTPCHHGGTCTDLIGGFSCKCDDGWTGSQCNDLVESCTPGLCQGGGICINLFQGFFCSCPRGVHGDNCEKDNQLCENANPCLNGGTCNQGATCTCPFGYTGAGCQLEVEFCAHPHKFCHNGATCVTLLNDFDCLCLPGYTGDQCESLTSDVTCPADCPARAECIQGPGTYTCRCPLGYTGAHCDKATDTDFDLFFMDASSHAELLAPFSIENVETLVVRMHVRYSEEDGDGTFFELDGLRIDKDTNQLKYTTLLYMDATGAHLTDSDGHTESYHYDQAQVLVNINDRLWHHLVVSLDGDGYFELYVDSVLQIRNQLTRQTAFEGHDLATIVLGSDFVGHISQVYVMNRTLDFAKDVLQPSVSCRQVDRADLVADWGNYDITPGTYRVTPSRCPYRFERVEEKRRRRKRAVAGGYYSVTPIPGHRITGNTFEQLTGVNTADDCVTLCVEAADYSCHSVQYKDSTGDCQLSQCTRDSCLEDWQTDVSYDYYEVDYIIANKPARPELVFCPEAHEQYSGTRLTTVSWDDPVFEPNDGSLTVYTNYDSGSVFIWGEYVVSYVAVNSEGETAHCDFTINIYEWQCSQADLPETGTDITLVCSIEDQTQVCQPVCTDPTQHFCLPTPVLYSCGPGGAWSPRQPYDTGLLSCTDGVSSRLKEISVMITYPLNPLNPTPLKALDERIQHAYRVWNVDYNGLCEDAECSSLNTEIIKGSNVTVYITHNTTHKMLVGPAWEEISPEDLLTRKLFDEEGFDFTTSSQRNLLVVLDAVPDLSTAEVHTQLTCPQGNMASLDGDSCVECCAGSYYDNDTAVCQACPVGYYQDTSGQLTCLRCPAGGSTAHTGSTTIEDCATEVCEAGSFFHSDSKQCRECDVGFYQSQQGAFYCEPCLASQTTQSTGAADITDCYDLCESGTQLTVSLTCEPCPQGTYRTLGIHVTCQPCPSDLTTLDTGATSRDQCMYEPCEPGSYLDVDANTCEPCEEGTYQPERWQQACEDCPDGSTTETSGSTSVEHCRVVCGVGQESIAGVCKDCQYGHYKDSEGIQPCSQCPSGKSTSQLGATSQEQCDIVDCGPGTAYSHRSATCEPCPQGFYRDLPDGLQCLQCPLEFVTPTAGARLASECVVGNCTSGSYIDPSDNSQCLPCPPGSYQHMWWLKSCRSCPEGHWTVGSGAASVKQCVSSNECINEEHNCHANALCHDLEGIGFTCSCLPGYKGDGYTCQNRCDQEYCLNGGTCVVSESGDAYCQCKKYYHGLQCERRESSYDEDKFTLLLGLSIGSGVLLILLGACIIGACYGSSPKSSAKSRDTGIEMAVKYGTLPSKYSGQSGPVMPVVLQPAVLPQQPVLEYPTYPGQAHSIATRWHGGALGGASYIREPTLFSVMAGSESQAPSSAYKFYEDVDEESMDILDDEPFEARQPAVVQFSDQRRRAL